MSMEEDSCAQIEKVGPQGLVRPINPIWDVMEKGGSQGHVFSLPNTKDHAEKNTCLVFGAWFRMFACHVAISRLAGPH